MKYTVYLRSPQGLVTFNTFCDDVETAINNACKTLHLQKSAVIRTLFEEKAKLPIIKKKAKKKRFSMRAEFLPKFIV